VTSKERLPLLPDVPAVSESVPGFNVDVWTGLVSQSKVPQGRQKILRDALTETVNDPAFQERLNQTGDTVAIGIGQDFSKRISDDLAMWRNVMKEANIRPITP
jgi:tripartite-type tricarboxylate transporter receptor subunit TctC